jgi:hypothetical protein
MSLRPSHVVDRGGDVQQYRVSRILKEERPYYGPSHVVEGGGDAYQYRVSRILKGERPYYGPSHVVEGGGDSLQECLRDVPISPTIVHDAHQDEDRSSSGTL